MLEERGAVVLDRASARWVSALLLGWRRMPEVGSVQVRLLLHSKQLSTHLGNQIDILVVSMRILHSLNLKTDVRMHVWLKTDEVTHRHPNPIQSRCIHISATRAQHVCLDNPYALSC